MFFHTAPVENQFEFAPVLITGSERIFGGLGRLRIPTTDNPPGIVIIFVSFEYNPDDRAFTEELALRIGEFRNVIREYIGSFSVAELQQLSEDAVRLELLRRFNAILRLGRIEVLFFNDFMIVG